MPSPNVDHVVQLYGDILFDLCESVLWSPAQAQTAFRGILKDLRKTGPRQRYSNHERAWVLRVAFERLRTLAPQHVQKITASEQIELDATPGVAARLKQFESHFRRLSTEEQIVLLLRDKYGLPYIEIAGATGLPEGTIKGLRQQALRALERWIWEDA